MFQKWDTYDIIENITKIYEKFTNHFMQIGSDNCGSNY